MINCRECNKSGLMRYDEHIGKHRTRMTFFRITIYYLICYHLKQLTGEDWSSVRSRSHCRPHSGPFLMRKRAQIQLT